ncbi:MAG: glycyl-radical enzyme activating protein [Candidatus Cloacimonetes bacterium]|nr:glycyl-radical enzyme activating protein [Candidatus Cloacimonadota bacterium]MCF7814609.1 glycyl-radical enzyme activating protein [Candidatus Cloacimonadota bacterium]MCF7868107.1 glycyl-radical enzyme activating protein [Candidatus Cloacimonadota bacterium]MCF7883573.1 glycyl-radical enzyme activating protein [Candidatus Cloacimonadota bacterium]
MQKGIIFDIKRFAVHDGPGIRTTVFFKGCPLNCWWCHNPESIDSKPQKITKQIALDDKIFDKHEIIGREMTVQEVMTEILKDKIFFDQSGGGVTFSGGEPLLQFDFLKEILEHCKKERLHLILDTCGLAPQKDLEQILDFVDLFFFDLKNMAEELHKKYVGTSNKIILENLKFLAENQKQIIIRFPLIPGVTDTDKNLDEMLEFLKTLPQIKEINLLPYHNIAEEKYRRLNLKYYEFSEPTQEKLDTVKQFWTDAGYKVKIGG